MLMVGPIIISRDNLLDQEDKILIPPKFKVRKEDLE
jgi:hypothetical protein